jgi:DNA (cytosine-5)-methyltransferase 1
MKLLDLFCGAGGASMGYDRAGFEVTGIDLKHGKRYPYTYIKGNVMDFIHDVDFLRSFDVIHASPPCQTFSATKHLRNAQGRSTDKLDLVEPVRSALIAAGVPYVIENVIGAPLVNPVTLCGSAFGLKVRRHRLFESSEPLTGTTCSHATQGKPVGIYGSMRDEIPNGGHTAKTMEEANQAMGITHMIWSELVESIPPAYTEYIGKQLRHAVLSRTYVNVFD